MAGKEGKDLNLKCKYYPKALCLRDNHNDCENCPYYDLYKRENRNSRSRSK